ncbi:ABC transporter permease subunit [Paraburkholderia sp. UYCP14C]|uniref:ABC transporter permease subunit n=1 Tax=Paraburkholderia sp. UYCP14C TaxID=2511130 RepID=UPI0010213DCD|nr:ABC transporter permease subunit [Paraburkholderia sp. UYCP14C]RZF23928.1 ABC transporter permease subunit [Paraburkholderia sp. UYCP14C]
MSPELTFSPVLWMAILKGLRVTVLLTVLSMSFGLALGTALALLRQYGGSTARAFSATYVFLFRGVPLLILLYFLYYGAPQFAPLRTGFLWNVIFSSAFNTCVLAFALNNAAYLAEAIRGGILTVKKGEIEAGHAVGLSGNKVIYRIVLPLAFRSCLYSIGNEAIFTIKSSAIASVITVRDVMGEAQSIGNYYSDNLSPLLATVVVYVVLVQLIEWGIRRLRHRFQPSSARRLRAQQAAAKLIARKL